MLVHLEYLDSELVQPPELQQSQRVGFAKQALLLEWQPGFAPQQQLDSQPVVLEVARPIKKKGSYQKQECTMRIYTDGEAVADLQGISVHVLELGDAQFVSHTCCTQQENCQMCIQHNGQ